MEYVLCMIMVYYSVNGEFKTEPMPIYGRFIKQSGDSDQYFVDFTNGYKIAKVENKFNVEYQWVHHNLCTWLKKGEIPK